MKQGVGDCFYPRASLYGLWTLAHCSCRVATCSLSVSSETCTKLCSLSYLGHSAATRFISNTGTLYCFFFLWERYMPKCQCDCEWTESIWVNSCCVLQYCSSAINWSSSLFLCANTRVCPIKLLSGLCWYYLKESTVSESKMEEELKS